MIQFLAQSKLVSGITGCRRTFPRHLLYRIARQAVIVCVVLLTQTLLFSPVNADSASRPNIVLILTDDQGWGDLGSSGNDLIQTPSLDALSKESVRLDRFYVSPVCAPTRAALLTGRYPERTGVAGVTGRREVMRSDETTMAEVFREAGYATGCFGKWHNGAQMPLHPNGQGFDEFFGFCGGHFNLYDDPLLERNGVPEQTRGYITDVLTDAAIEFLETPREQPFFCYVPFNAPHGPFQVRQDLFDKYNTGEVSEKTAAVYAMVENIDDNVSRLMATLDRNKMAENTIVVFLTDNGPNGKRFNGGMKGTKGSVHEGGCRVPCFIRWPGHIEPKTISQITGHIDLLPTLAQWCDVSLKDTSELDGKSLVNLVKNGSDDALSDRMIFAYRPNQLQLAKFGKAAVRTNRFRMTSEKGNVSLFDMKDDPGQKQDVADEHPDIARELKNEIDQYFETVRPSIDQTRWVPITKGRPTFIPSVDARLSGKPAFADGISWAHSWVDNWVSKNDVIAWPVEFAESGRYQITLHYVCNSKSVSIAATVGDQKLTSQLVRFKSDSTVRPDLDTESTARRMLTFRDQSLGVVEVSSGRTEIELARLGSGKEMIELGGVTITSADVPSKETFHLFLLAGQSNMAGRGKVTAIDKYPDPNILMLDRDNQWIPATDPMHFDKSIAGVGLGREFARRYLAEHPGVTVGLVPCAVGGSPIAAWQPGGFHVSTKTHPYDDAVARIQAASESGVFKAILWHQGESDCKPGQSERYKSDLAKTLGRFRKLVGAPTPILIGGLAKREHPAWTMHRKRVDRSHRELGNELPQCIFVESDGLTLKSDNIHFDRESLNEFGGRYAEALKQLVPSN